MKLSEKRADVAALVAICEKLGLKPLTADLIYVVDDLPPMLTLHAIKRLSATSARPDAFMSGYRAHGEKKQRRHPYRARFGGYARAWEEGYDVAAQIAEAMR